MSQKFQIFLIFLSMLSTTQAVSPLDPLSSQNLVTIDIYVPKPTDPNYEPQNFFNDSSRSSRITRGSPATNGQFPFAAYLHIVRGGQTTFCTGALIASNWILTARSCYVLNPNNPADTLRAFVGSNDNQSPSLVNAFSNHGAYFNNPNGINPDIAVFRLVTNLPTTNLIRPVRLPRLVDEHARFENREITTIGWGRLLDNTFPRILQFGRFRILGNHLCQWARTFRDSDFCSQHQTRITMVADGDTGGPSVMREADGQWTVVGVTSGTIGLPNGVAATSVRVTSFLRFINQNTGIPARR